VKSSPCGRTREPWLKKKGPLDIKAGKEEERKLWKRGERKKEAFLSSLYRERNLPFSRARPNSGTDQPSPSRRKNRMRTSSTARRGPLARTISFEKKLCVHPTEKRTELSIADPPRKRFVRTAAETGASSIRGKSSQKKRPPAEKEKKKTYRCLRGKNGSFSDQKKDRAGPPPRPVEKYLGEESISIIRKKTLQRVQRGRGKSVFARSRKKRE